MEHWFKLIVESRRKYAFGRLRELDGFHPSSLKRALKWVYLDIRFVIQNIREIYLEIKRFGPSIKYQYEISVPQQLIQQLYLVFFLRVSLKHYRGYLLFKKNRWAMVQQFTYENYPVQMKLVDSTFPEEQKLFNNKLNFYRHCLKNDIFTPTVLGVFKEGKEIFSEKKPFKLPEEDLFVKDLYGRRGQGITKYNFTNGVYTCSRKPNRQSGELIQLLRDQSCRNEGIMVQKTLHNHKDWKQFTSGALCTCRVLTGKIPESDKISVLAATLRMPTGCTETDNTSTGGIASAIDIETGILVKGIRKKPLNGKFEFDRHPDTSQLIAGTPVPFWFELMEFAISAHGTFNTLFVGWDIALTVEGFALIEGNIGWSVRVVESPQGRTLTQTQFPTLYEGWMRKQLQLYRV